MENDTKLVLKFLGVIISLIFYWMKIHMKIFWFISYETLIGAKYLGIRFDKINGFIRVYDATRYLALLCCEKHDTISDRIKHFIRLKSGITYVFSYIYVEIKIDSDDDLPLEETFTLRNVIIHNKAVLNKDHHTITHS